jgi:hypothetical protein
MKHLKKNKKKKKQQQRKTNQTAEACWVDELAFVPVQPHRRVEDADDSLSIVSWNVLAESYCSPRSHPNLPKKYQSKVFTPIQRRKVLQTILQHKVMVTTDVLCLQEVDLREIGESRLKRIVFSSRTAQILLSQAVELWANATPKPSHDGTVLCSILLSIDDERKNE